MERWMSWLLGPGHFVHRLDPVLLEVGGVYLWYYGLSYSLGFLGVYWWLRRARERLGLSVPEVYDLSILMALAVLLMGRAVEVLYYELPYYRTHPREILNYWQGGMSSHGLLLGGCLGAWLFCRARGRAFREIADELAVPGALLLAVGRVGNFFDGQIVGGVTDAWWAVKFPDAEGFRHPVVLYDAVKNLLIVPVLLLLRRRAPAPGNQLAHFVFWYGAGRVFVDLFREYPAQVFGLGTGQYLNLATAAGGVGLMLWLARRPTPVVAPRFVPAPSVPERKERRAAMAAKRLAFAFLVAFPLVIPSDWTQDVPERYGKRHPIQPSSLYRPLDPGH